MLATHARASVPTPAIIGPITSPGGAFIRRAASTSQFGVGRVLRRRHRARTGARCRRRPRQLDRDARRRGAYKTRVLVRRPTSPRKFNGTVIVEWLNVSGGLDAAPDWTFLHPFLKRDGYAWIGVSAQFVGVEGGSSPIGLNLSLKAVSPARYGTLAHPGDTFVRHTGWVRRCGRQPSALLGVLAPRRVIAIGESQSAFRMTTYVNAIHRTRTSSTIPDPQPQRRRAAVSQNPQPAIGAPTPTFVRGDVDVPVLIFEIETDSSGPATSSPASPTNDIRTWEVAGTAHDDAYGLNVGPNDGKAAMDTTYLPPQTSIFGVIQCAKPINQGPQHYVLSVVVRRLNRWSAQAA
jgi:hypothetical protein